MYEDVQKIPENIEKYSFSSHLSPHISVNIGQIGLVPVPKDFYSDSASEIELV